MPLAFLAAAVRGPTGDLPDVGTHGEESCIAAAR